MSLRYRGHKVFSQHRNPYLRIPDFSLGLLGRIRAGNLEGLLQPLITQISMFQE